MSEPERWLTSADAPGPMRDLLSAAQKVGPTTIERAALAGKLGVATSGLWIVPALKGLAGAALVAGGVWMATADGDPARQDTSRQQDAAGPQNSSEMGSASATPSSLAPSPAGPAPEVAAAASAPEAPAPKSADTADEPGSRKARAPGVSVTAPRPSEISLIAGARNSLESAPQKALSLLSEHAKLYPSGVLAEEREVLRIRALKSLGREKDAKAQQQKFHQEHPESVHHVP